MKIYSNEEIIRRKLKKEKSIEKVKLILVILISLFIIYNLSLIIQAILAPSKTPNWMGYKTFSIISGSMMPEIEVGDIVIIKEVPEEDLKEGDIISFRENTEIITHRIIDVFEENETKVYITKGDNNNVQDENKVKYSSIEGKLVKKIPEVGKVVIFLKNKITLIVIILFFVITYMIDSNGRNKRLIREKKKELLNKQNQG